MDDELGGMFQERYGGTLTQPIPRTEKKPLRYRDMYPEDSPKPGVIGDIRTGFGHLAQVPGDVAEAARMGEFFPDTLQSIQESLGKAGNYIAGGDLGGDTGVDWLMGAIRERIREGSLFPNDPSSRMR